MQMAPLTWQIAAIQGMRRDQIAARLRLRTQRALESFRPFPAARRPAVAGITTQDLRLQRPQSGWPEAGLASLLEQAARVAAGRFRFLNEERGWALPGDWQAVGAARLWRFHLHYF